MTNLENFKPSSSYIETYTSVFEPLYPEQYKIKEEDIAHALSQICRFTGHCKFFYSVAQHSLNVAKLLKIHGFDENIQLEGLLHDASEAYICDVARPIKSSLLNYKELETNIQKEIYCTFGVKSNEISYNFVKQMDDVMLHEESVNLMHNRTLWASSELSEEIKKQLDITYRPMIDVEKEFLRTLYNYVIYLKK